jgi:TusE/DsrC/DsvC family sulfur relay protein
MKVASKVKAGVYELFPSGPAKGACKVAGLPKPTGCV